MRKKEGQFAKKNDATCRTDRAKAARLLLKKKLKKRGGTRWNECQRFPLMDRLFTDLDKGKIGVRRKEPAIAKVHL